MMFLHSSFTYILAVLGVYTGLYILLNLKKVREDKVTRLFFIILGTLYFYTGIVYTLIIFGIIGAIPPTQASLFMRPANILFIVTPFMIAKRMGL